MINSGKKKKLILTLIVIFSFLFFCLMLGISIINSNRSKALGDTIAVGDINRPVTDSKQEGRNLQQEVKDIHSKYPEAVAWLKVPGTSIDRTIFQTNNNDKYLKTNRDGKKTQWGESFLDYRCNINNLLNPGNYIIYGHNTEKDDNFTPLLNYKKKSFFDNHSEIELATVNGDYKFKIFSVYVTDTNFFYIDTNFETSKEFTDFENSVKSKSVYDTGVNPGQNDTILTLSTCDYTQNEGRFVIHAILEK